MKTAFLALMWAFASATSAFGGEYDKYLEEHKKFEALVAAGGRVEGPDSGEVGDTVYMPDGSYHWFLWGGRYAPYPFESWEALRRHVAGRRREALAQRRAPALAKLHSAVRDLEEVARQAGFKCVISLTALDDGEE